MIIISGEGESDWDTCREGADDATREGWKNINVFSDDCDSGMGKKKNLLPQLNQMIIHQRWKLISLALKLQAFPQVLY